MWFLFGLVTLLAGIAFEGLRRYRASVGGEARPGGFRVKLRLGKNRQLRAVVVALVAPASLDFECRRETGVDVFFKDLGLSTEFQIGDLAFDEDVYLVAEDPRMRDCLANDPALVHEIQVLMGGLLPGFEFKSLICRGGRLRVEFKAQAGHDQAERLVKEAMAHLSRIRQALPPDGLPGRKAVDPWFRRSVIVLALSSGLAINGVVQLVRLNTVDSLVTLEGGALPYLGAATGLVLFGLLVQLCLVLLRGSSRLHLVLVEVLLVGGFGSFSSGILLARDANMAIDAEPPRTVLVHVVGRESHRKWLAGRRSRGTARRNYYLRYEGAELGAPFLRRVSHSEYLSAANGAPARAELHAGALGIPWVDQVQWLTTDEAARLREATAPSR